ncbi:MAG TPA: coproporphyrinogen III oxidase family protein [Syntrophorhabdaceae bacterium]|jgi:coproporphyrinogen III oxidase-like Fe-S oxidoreductase
MLIEKLITSIARKKNSDYLRFSASSASVPRAPNDLPRLVYVHIPFCEELCPYCSFNRIVFREPLARSYFKALRKEVLMYRDLGYEFSSLYVGGGTPTVLVDELAETIDLIKKSFPVKEVSVETNPNHLTDENIALLQAAGVHRLSVGVQSFDDGILKATERYHKYGSGEMIAERLQYTQGKFQTLNIDMIFNFPAQSMAILEKDLSTLVGLGVDQITYYPLMVSTFTQAAMNKKLGIVNYERGGALYEKIVEMLTPTYEATTAWCFSRHKGMIDEYVINFEEYAGLGSGSIGYLGGSVYANTFDIEEYVKKLGRGEPPVTARRDFSMKERLRYDFLMKLFGLKLDIKELGKKTGVNPLRYLWTEILFFMLAGGLKKQGSCLTLTRKGQYYWVLMMREFFIGVNNFRDYCRRELMTGPK